MQDQISSFEHALQAKSIGIFPNVVFGVDGVGQVHHHHPPVILIVVLTGIAEFVQELEQEAA